MPPVYSPGSKRKRFSPRSRKASKKGKLHKCLGTPRHRKPNRSGKYGRKKSGYRDKSKQRSLYRAFPTNEDLSTAPETVTIVQTNTMSPMFPMSLILQVRYRNRDALLKGLVVHATDQVPPHEEAALQRIAAEGGLAPGVLKLMDMKAVVADNTTTEFPVTEYREDDNDDDKPFPGLLMEYAAGVEIDAFLADVRKKPKAERQKVAVALANAVAAALQKLAGMGIHHGDVESPLSGELHNIFVDRRDDAYKIQFIDFGMAKRLNVDVDVRAELDHDDVLELVRKMLELDDDGDE